MTKYTAAKRATQKKIGDKPRRQYKLTGKQAAKAEKAYTKGMPLAKLRKIVGASKQAVSQWMRGRGVARKHPSGLSLFQRDVKSTMRIQDLPYHGKEGALRYTMDSEYWSSKRIAKLKKSLEPYMERFQAGKPETAAQKKRRHWLQGKIQSEELRKDWSDYKQGRRSHPDEDDVDDEDEDDFRYEDWGGK